LFIPTRRGRVLTSPRVGYIRGLVQELELDLAKRVALLELYWLLREVRQLDRQVALPPGVQVRVERGEEHARPARLVEHGGADVRRDDEPLQRHGQPGLAYRNDERSVRAAVVRARRQPEGASAYDPALDEG
jgi:hypothetical protein